MPKHSEANYYKAVSAFDFWYRTSNVCVKEACELYEADSDLFWNLCGMASVAVPYPDYVPRELIIQIGLELAGI